MLALDDMVSVDRPLLSSSTMTFASDLSSLAYTKLLSRAFRSFYVIFVHLHNLTIEKSDINVTILIHRSTHVPLVSHGVRLRGLKIECTPSTRRFSASVLSNPTARCDEISKKPHSTRLLTQHDNKPSENQRAEGTPSKRQILPTVHEDPPHEALRCLEK